VVTYKVSTVTESGTMAFSTQVEIFPKKLFPWKKVLHKLNIYQATGYTERH